MIRIAPLSKSASTPQTIVESTNGIVLFRLVLPQECDREVFVSREIVQRLKELDEVVISDLEMCVEGNLQMQVDEQAAPALVDESTGRAMRLWPEFDALIPKGKRAAASLIGVGAPPLSAVVRCAKHLGSKDDPVVLGMAAGGAAEAVKLTSKCVYGDALWLVMPCTIIEEAPAKEQRDGKAAAAGDA
jgi:hypothetical protein